jgi:hypothetical protein
LELIMPKIPGWMLLLGAGAVIWYLSRQFQKQITDPLATGIANLWVKLFDAPSMVIPGNVVLPDGSKIPVNSLVIKTDTLNNLFTQISGRIYQFQPSDPITGDWPLKQVS